MEQEGATDFVFRYDKHYLIAKGLPELPETDTRQCKKYSEVI